MPIKRPHHIADNTKKIPIANGGCKFDPRGLNIVWGSDPRYWNIPDIGPATLIQVSWLEVSGSFYVERGKRYKISFEVSLKPDSFGWNGSQVLVMAKVGKKGTYDYKEVSLKNERTKIPSDDLIIQVREDATDLQLYFGLYEVWSGKWKGGLEIHGANVEPV